MNIRKLSSHLDVELVGGKAASLSKMLNASIQVPQGFVLDKTVHKSYVLNNDYINSIKKDIALLLKDLSSPFVMVRSSAIGEDSIDSSFAGQLDSYQCENEIDLVLRNIERCWSSLQNKRVKDYEIQSGKVLTEMAVIVQEMIEPEYAGVFFTTSPISQEGNYLEYIQGHAEKLVQGEVTPESFEFNATTIKNFECPFNLKELTSECSKILKLYENSPQDIEWTYRDNQFYFVQSRPITTLKEKIKWSNTNVNENYPDKLSPLLYSIAKQSYYHYYKNLALSLSVITKEDDQYEKYFSNAIGTFGHRMYYSMSSIHSIIELSPISNLLRKSFDDFVGYQKESSISQNVNNNIQKFKICLKMIYHLITLPSKVDFIEQRVTRYSDVQSKKLSYAQLVDQFYQFLFIRFHLWVNASFADFYAMLSHGLLGRFLKYIKLENAQSLHNGLIQSIPNLVSHKPLIDLWLLVHLIKENDEFNTLFTNEPKEIIKLLNSENQYNDLNIKFDEYLNNWGYRCPGELTFLRENYIENPTPLINIIKTYMNSNPVDPKLALEKNLNEQKSLHNKTKKEIKSKFILNPIKRSLFPFILKMLSKMTMFSISSRERVRLKQAQMYYTFKETCLYLADILIKNKVLQKRSDIFFLEYSEINKILSGEELSKEYIEKLIELRRQTIENAKEQPDNIFTFRQDLGQKIFNQDFKVENIDGVFKGLAACSGVIQGRIVVITDISQINKIKKGDILVTKQTDPGWICIFPMISGLVVEKGGVLSHSAIVAREFGVPAVVGIPNITEILKDNQEIIVNGDIGVVQCL